MVCGGGWSGDGFVGWSGWEWMSPYTARVIDRARKTHTSFPQTIVGRRTNEFFRGEGVNPTLPTFRPMASTTPTMSSNSVSSNAAHASHATHASHAMHTLDQLDATIATLAAEVARVRSALSAVTVGEGVGVEGGGQEGKKEDGVEEVVEDGGQEGKGEAEGEEAWVEPILRPSVRRFVMRPSAPEYPSFFEYYKKHESTIWTAEEIDLSEDQWDSLDPKAQHFISRVLAFFAASDGIVNENISVNFADEIQVPEARAFYDVQTFMERIHSEVYSILIESLVPDRAAQDALFAAIETDPSIRAKAQWAQRWMDRDAASFAERIVAFAAVEGIFFAGSFCAIFWIKKQQRRYKLPGLCFSNELISRDEKLHCEFACDVYSKLRRRLPFERVKEIVCSAVECEIQFITESVSVDMIEMSREDMAEHIRYMADFLSHQLGYPPIYDATEPFEWFDLISAEGKTNFFEKRVGEYVRANVGSKTATSNRALCTNADF